jgi:hypothetical protein
MMQFINTNKLSTNQALIDKQLLIVNLSIDKEFKDCIESDIIDAYKELILTILPANYKNMSEEDFDWYFLDERVIDYLQNNVINQINNTLLDKTLNELIEETKSYVKVTSNIKCSEIFYRFGSSSFGLLLDEGSDIDSIDKNKLEEDLKQKLYDMISDLNDNIKEIYMTSCFNTNFFNFALNRFLFRHSVEEVQESLNKQIKNYNHKFNYRELFENVSVTINIERLLDIEN